MDEHLQIPDFCKKRVAANGKIRIGAGQPEDFLLREIYDYYEGISEEDRNHFAELECALEIESCEPRSDIKEIFEACLRMGKPVLLISDIYLPRECITAMLEKCGFQGYTALYISGEERLLKLTGHLFRTI